MFARPPDYPTFVSWLITGATRNWRGLLGALLATWFNLPLAIFLGGVGLVMGGILGYFGGFVGADTVGVEYITDVPVLGTMLKSFLVQSGGIVGGLGGAAVGAIGGFVGGLVLPWALVAADDPAKALGLMLAQLVVALLVGVLYTIFEIAAEGWLMRINGYREPSRREKELIMPVLTECARRLHLGGYPKLLIDDSRQPNAYAGSRHIVVARGFLDEFNYETEPLAGALCHELTHWRNADAISGMFVRGIALPLYLTYVVVTRLTRVFRHPVIEFLSWAIAWPLLVAIRYFVMPLQAAGSRAAEYRADQGAVKAGFSAGQRRVLSRFRRSFDGARNGWELSVCATHPPNELRLERLEELGVRYWLPDQDAPARPLPVVMTSALTRD